MKFIDLKAQYGEVQASIARRINDVLEHGQYVLGPEVSELESKLAAYTGAKHCISVSSGTDALLIALMALGIKRDDEIITTPFTFISTAETVALAGAKPVFVDIDPRTYNIDPGRIEDAITPRTKAIVPVGLYGQCAEMDAINDIAGKHGLTVIEDAAQSFGATYKGRKSCALSTIGCTSFFPSKPLGCYGDGGACFTDDDAIAETMREIRVHGQRERYQHAILGLNGRMDTLQAAILLAKLEIFPKEVELRAEIGARYSERISEMCGNRVTVPHIETHNASVFAQYTVAVDTRDAVVSRLNESGIPTAIHYAVPLHQQQVFRHAGDIFVPHELSNAEQAASSVFSLPMHPYLSGTQIDMIVDKLSLAIGAAGQAA